MSFSDMDNFLLVLFVSFLLNTTFGFDHSKYTVIVQQSISVQRGLCVYIPCTFTVESGSTSAQAYGMWKKGGQYGEVVSSQNPSKYPPQNPGRIFFTGDATKLDCSMSINDVQSNDSDTSYLFRLQDDGGVKYYYYNYMIDLNVTELTDKPVITPETPLLADKEVTLTCESPGRCNGSAPLITWNREGVQGTSVTHTTIHPDGNKTYYSNITFTPSKKDHQSFLTCIVSFQASSASTQNQIILNVEYAPRTPQISCSMTTDCTIDEHNTIYVQEGSTLSLRCFAESFPEASITWLIPRNLNNTSPTGKIDLHDMSCRDHGLYTCKATNVHGNSSTSLVVKVFCSRCMDNQIIIGILIGNIFVLLLLGLGVFCFIKRHMEKKIHRTESNDFQLHDAKGTESVYQDLNKPSDSIYNSIQSAKQ